MSIRADDGRDFHQLALRLRKAGRSGAIIRKATTVAIRKELAPVVEDIKREIAALNVREGGSGRGSLARQRFASAVELRRREKARLANRRVRARKGGHGAGLRITIRSGVRSRVQYSGFRLGARIFVDTSGLPQSQRTLPRHPNSEKGWRHPVWGNREVWVRQLGEPYFDRPIERHRARVVPAVNRHVNAALRQVLEV